MTDDSLRSLIRTMDGLLYQSALNSGSTGADYVFECDASGRVQVDRVPLAFPASDASFGSIVAGLQDNGYSASNRKYVVWYDDGGTFSNATRWCGQGSVWDDENASVANYNNSGGSYAITYDDVIGCDFSTIMHELGHNLGAVQYDAPYSTGAFHCFEGHVYSTDVMCYNDGGPEDPGYIVACGSSLEFDCNHNDYFDAKIGAGQGGGAGSYLDINWNIGACYDRWIVNYSCQGVAPTVTAFSPTNGPEGTSVSISGTGFTGATDVELGATSASYTVNSSTSITATVPAGASSGSWSVTTPDGTATSSDAFTVTPPAPLISGFTPTSGPVGTSVAITGSSFDGATAVRFNGTSASFTVDDSSDITATVPAGASDGTISVTTPGGTVVSASSFNMTLPPPTVDSFSPPSGPVGTSVTITGTHLTGATAVTFHGTSATTFTVDSATQVTAKVPAGGTSGPIAVTTPGGVATSASDFTVTVAAPAMSGFSPGSGGVGTVVTVNGTNMSSASAVSFGGVATAPTFVSATQVKAPVPAGAATGRIGVTNPGGTGLSAGTFKVLPKLTSFEPGSGASGDSVTIAGSGFTGVSAVKLNGVATDFTADSDHQITATVPATATTGRLSVVTAGGTATSLTNFVVVPTITGFAPGAAAAGSPEVVDGTGFGGVSSVKVNGVAARFSVLSKVQLRLTVPAAASSGPITVTTAGGTATSPSPLSVLPRVTGFTPSSARVGATVTISGNGFGGTINVLFNGVIAVPATVTATKVTVVVPSSASTGKLTAVTGAGSGQSAGTFKVLPTLDGFGPSFAPSGASVTIAGTGFADVSAVKFNGVAASYVVDWDHQITATVPATATTGKLQVVTAGGTATSLLNFLAVPTITGFSPGTAPPESTVTADGTGFGGVTSVKVNGVAAGFSVLSKLQLRLKVPASATSGLISVTTAGGTATSGSALAVSPRVTGFAPGAALVGATVTISGNAYGGATNVFFNGVATVPATVLPTKVTVPVPADASTGKLTVVTAAGAGQSAATFKVLPKLISFSPGSGVVSTSVTITGTGFTDVTAVKFNGHTASSWTRDSSTQITAMVPLGATTGKISVVTAGGTTTSATNFTVVP